MPETKEERDARKAREAELAASETPEQRAAREAKEAERARRRAAETPEERAIRKAKEAEAEKRRATETPEERAARKAREADRGSRRADETPEQRAARKAREAEQQRQQEAPDAREKPVIHRSATQAPPSPAVNAAQSPAAGGRADAGSGATAEKPIQFAPPPKSGGTAKPTADDDDGYEDDFEEVFEADALAEALKATAAANASLKTQQQQHQNAVGAAGGKSSGAGGKAAEVVYEGKARAGLDADSLTRQKHKLQFEKDLARATALRRLVDLDEAKFTIVDISPQSQYEVFLRNMQAAATPADQQQPSSAAQQHGATGGALANASTQAPLRVDCAIQAERATRKMKTGQVPDDLGLFPEGARTTAAATTTPGDGTRNAGDDNNDAGSTAESKPSEAGKPRQTAFDKRRADMGALGAFLANVFPCMRTLMDENEAMLDPKGARRTNASGTAKHSFTTTASALIAPVAEGRAVVRSEYSQISPNYLLVAHGPLDASAAPGIVGRNADAARAALYDGVALLWNVNDPSRPDKVLVAPAAIVDVCLSPSKAHLVYGALSDGSLCTWDLREPEGAHGGSAVVLGLRAPSYATGWNAADLHSAGVKRLRVSGYNSALGSAAAAAEETEQLVSLDSDGGVSFWMVSDGAQREVVAASSMAESTDKIGSSLGAGAGLKRSGSFTFAGMNSPSRRRGASGAAQDSDCGLAVSSSVHLYRSATVNALTDIRAKSAARRSDSHTLGTATEDAKYRIDGVVSDFDMSPTDASHMMVGSTTGVLHVSKFGAITAPALYGPAFGLAPAVSCVAACQQDSRLLLVGYDNGTCRLYLRDDAGPRLTLQLSSAAVRQVTWSSKRWVAFALDSDGTVFVLDFAAANKAKPVASASAASGSKFTSISVNGDDRETKVALGHSSGRVEVHSFNEAVLPVPNLRDEQWL